MSDKTLAVQQQQQGTALAMPLGADIMEKVLVGGDLSELSPRQRLDYYLAYCQSLGLNPLTRPFGYILFEDKKTGEKRLELYAKKDASEQLAYRHQVNIEIRSREVDEDGVYTVHVRITDPQTGRFVDATGAVALTDSGGKQIYGTYRANLKMKGETKAARRGTLRFCGLGVLDESEVETVPGARIVQVDPQTGEITHVSEPMAGEEKTTGKNATGSGNGQPEITPEQKAAAQVLWQTGLAEAIALGWPQGGTGERQLKEALEKGGPLSLLAIIDAGQQNDFVERCRALGRQKHEEARMSWLGELMAAIQKGAGDPLPIDRAKTTRIVLLFNEILSDATDDEVIANQRHQFLSLVNDGKGSTKQWTQAQAIALNVRLAPEGHLDDEAAVFVRETLVDANLARGQQELPIEEKPAAVEAEPEKKEGEVTND